MIILKRDGQFGEFYNRYGLAPPTNFCQLLWKTFCVMLLFIFVGMIGVFYLVGAFMTFLHFEHFTVSFFLGISILLLWTGGAILHGKWRLNHPKPMRVTPQWKQNISEAYKGFKEKYCPLVRFEDG